MKVQSCIDYFLQCNKVKLPYICLDSVVRKFNKNKSLLINIVCFLIREKRIESWSKYIFFQLSFMYKVSHVEISKGIFANISRTWLTHWHEWRWLGRRVCFQEFKYFETPLYTLFNRFSIVEFQLGILFWTIQIWTKTPFEAWLKFSYIYFIRVGQQLLLICTFFKRSYENRQDTLVGWI